MKKKISSKETWWSCDGHRVMSVQTFGITCDLREALADSNRKPQDYLSVLHRQDVFKWYQHAYLQALYLSRVLNVYENKKKSWYWTRFSVIFSPVILLQFTTTLFFIFQIDLKLLCVIGLFQQKMENINMFKLNI